MNCRPQCGACCIAPSISSPIPGMPDGKPAGTPCIHLADDLRCNLFGLPERPQVCADFDAVEYVCGDNRQQALTTLQEMESATQPLISIKDLT
ncbi:YkgJ family cysteine cluster protein [Marinomonas ostreistagni]|uniref:YkgJ family cysteine cluster protein n=1 Tax=Marinomonas ostreistagni TaxID=359209 RepID=UPI001950983D|nr:YkgJ family cysteine cluster protein [Marinomonas ostreistagni]MBM6549836.1 YkgJ family cysteine cluster protein [Marinomonas ostreistagni]